MNNSSLQSQALSVIDAYMHFKFGQGETNMPYFNNKTSRRRGAFRAKIGKGSPQEIADELKSIVIKNHIDINSINNETLKKILLENDLGMDCSGLVFHILDAQNLAISGKPLSKIISFPEIKGLFSSFRAKKRPAENCDVANFAHNQNSTVIKIDQTKPGDIITMIDKNGKKSRNHIVIVHSINKESGLVKTINYTHTVAYAEDGLYGTGIRQGVIEITNSQDDITNQKWDDPKLLQRAKESFTELRRLNT